MRKKYNVVPLKLFLPKPKWNIGSTEKRCCPLFLAQMIGTRERILENGTVPPITESLKQDISAFKITEVICGFETSRSEDFKFNES